MRIGFHDLLGIWTLLFSCALFQAYSTFRSSNRLKLLKEYNYSLIPNINVSM